ncbi:hypothetical protein HBI42_103140 [Parastagonospora nodorum]|nr:hypothetical protein HBI43_106150 [Parastagonospora nodorum]KAH6258120.1 hypothetical protein HBI42_103140 [Parastagonospora nodorum]
MIFKRTTESSKASLRLAPNQLQKQPPLIERSSKTKPNMKPQKSCLASIRKKTKQLFELYRSADQANLWTTFVTTQDSTDASMKSNRHQYGSHFMRRFFCILGFERNTNKHLDDRAEPGLVNPGNNVSDFPDSGTFVPDDDESDCVDSGSVVPDDGESDYSDDGEPNECNKDDRRNFKAIRQISQEALEDLVLETLYPVNKIRSHTCRIAHRKEGSFHHCVFFDIDDGQESEQAYVLRIPAHGTQGKWQEEDAFMLRNEAVMMQHIRHHTKCPVPEVISFDQTLNNSIGAPYILMKKVTGMSALDVWQGNHLYEPPAPGDEYLNADQPSVLLEAIRINFIRSLAVAMSHLHKLEFSNIGVPVFEHPEDEEPSSIGPAYVWHTKSTMQPIKGIGPFPTSRQFFEAGVQRCWSLDVTELDDMHSDDEEMLEHKGIKKILNLVVESEPFAAPYESLPFDCLDEESATNPAAPKLFVLRHDDLDLQNILVDYKGNVTGIIDWDGCMAVPRCVGYTSLPTFLRRDWLPGHMVSGWPYITWSIQRYREAYSAAMKKACGSDNNDARFTKKSAIYQALFAVLYEDEECPTVLGNMLGEIDGFRRVDPWDLCVQLGKGWPAAEKVLKGKITHLLAP